MYVVVLNAEVQDAKSRAAGRGQGAPGGDEEASMSEGGHARGRPQRYVDRTVTFVGGAAPVRDRPAPRGGLAACAPPPPTPCADVKLQLLHSARHLDWADVYHKLASVSTKIWRPALGAIGRRGVGADAITRGCRR
jgi:hypothetical protein